MFIFLRGCAVITFKSRIVIYFGLALIFGSLSILTRFGSSNSLPIPSVLPVQAAHETIDLLSVLNKCNQGDSDQCLAVGYIHLRGVVGDRDFLLAKKYFEKACDGYIEPNRRELQCEAIARIFDDGKEARVDKKIANFFHEKARAAHLVAVSTSPSSRSEPESCDKGDRGSCFHGALKYLGQLNPDVTRAAILLEKACDDKGLTVTGEEYPGKFCGLAAEFFEYGRQGLPIDLNRAGDLYFKACHIAESSPQKNGFMCDLAGVFFRDKRDDRRVAATSFRTACALKSAGGCEHLQRLGESLNSL